MKTAPLFTRALALLAFPAASAAFGQSTAAASDPGSTPWDDAVELSPFEVNTDRDTGYTAASSLAGGRVELPLKFTPAAVSVLTREFIDDIGGTNLRDITKWAPNVVPEYQWRNEAAFGDFNYSVRGLGNSFPSRNYFLWYVDTDSYNTERFEFARGPNGVLFGDGNAGGIVTTWTHTSYGNLRPGSSRATLVFLPNQFRYLDPRQIIFSTSLTF